MWKRIAVLCVASFLAAFGQTPLKPCPPRSKLALVSPDARLVSAFDWAKQQALAYAFRGDPVGPWYEAALPGREAFCMRDVSHQAMGAQALGLARYTRNMLHRFAQNVSDSKDWCSYWEINRDNRPAPVDYRSNADFWYDLPANFDVLDACYRMFLWTGDRAYLNDPAFRNFYRRTMVDYVQRWDLDTASVMKRNRLLNVRGVLDPKDKFQISRGIPGYAEGSRDFVLGIDLLDAQYAAYRDYASIEAFRGHAGRRRRYLRRAAGVRALVNSVWWDGAGHHFYAELDSHHQLRGRASGDLLYRGAAQGALRIQSAVDDFVADIRRHPSSPAVEGESHDAEILYRYGHPKLAYAEMMDLARPHRYRQEYPEVSYSVIGAMTTGLMGINVVSVSAGDTGNADYVAAVIETLPSLTGATAWAELRNLPVRDNVITVRHTGLTKTVLVNEKGPALIWRAAFPGSIRTLLVNGQPMMARTEVKPVGRVVSFLQVPVGAGERMTVEVAGTAGDHREADGRGRQ